jgi:glycosyltransferase involved in cell wall biosynthesis
MRIAQLATNVESVPPGGYGGTELIVSLLTEELIARGHEVTLFATGDSKTKARLISTIAGPLRTATDQPSTHWPAFDLRTLIELEKRQGEFDIVHNHMGWQALPCLNNLHKNGLSVLSTNHNPVKEYVRDIYFEYAKLPFIAISKSYAHLNYPERINYAATVYNGININVFARSDEEIREGLLFIGRLGQDKGTAKAIDIARALDMPITLAGKVDKNDEDYFQKEVQPRLAAYGKAKFIGEVNLAQKIELYKSAVAVVYPIDFEEPFGLVMAESLAAGTPVMAFDRGSVREVLEDKVTAVIGKTEDDLIKRFPEIKKMSAQACRKRAFDNFSVKKMVDNYEHVYIQLLEQKNRAKTEPEHFSDRGGLLQPELK